MSQFPFENHVPAPLEAGLAERIHTPALVVDLAACRRNVDAVLELTGGPARWRPHVKTAKIPEVLRVYSEAGIGRFKCATTLEAEVLADALRGAGACDVLLAHHLYGPALDRFARFAADHPFVTSSTLVESVEQVGLVPEHVGLFIDVDLGMQRTGISIEREDEILAIARAAGPRFRGVHAYDGHRLEPDESDRRRRVHEAYDGLVALCRRLDETDAHAREVVTAGTPAFRVALAHAGLSSLEGTIHRVSPGTVVYHDLRSVDQLRGLQAEFAATVLTRVASLAGEGYTVDAGSKAIEAAGPDCIAATLERPRDRALGQSEEHTVLRADSGDVPDRGAILRLVPGHVCPTINLARRAVLVEDGRLVGIADVRAGAHDLIVEGA